MIKIKVLNQTFRLCITYIHENGRDWKVLEEERIKERKLEDSKKLRLGRAAEKEKKQLK